MSIVSCANCGDVYDTDYEMEVDEKGNCICDKCYELKQSCDRLRKLEEL